MMDLQIREFENTIINFCNNSVLPVEVKKLVIADILKQLEKESDRIINLEIEERNRKEKEKQHKTIEIDSSGEVVKEDEQSLSEDSVGELSE